MARGLIIFDFNRTLYNPDEDCLFEGVDYILGAYSRKYILAVIAKGDQKRKELLGRLGIEQFFQSISFKESKSENDYRECLRKFNYNPNQCWSIGDRIKSEIAISKNLGLRTIWFKNGKFSNEAPKDSYEQPDYTITFMSEIKNIIPL